MSELNRLNHDDYDLNSYKKNKKSKGKKNGLKILLIVLCSVVIVACAVFGGGYLYINSMLNRVERVEIDDSVSVASEAQKKYENYINIALLGIDTRKNNDEGRSDAIIILTLDSVHNKIKMTSIARDTYVEIVRNNGKTHKDKITHAYMYGKAAMSVDTINRNFEMNITDFVSINFYGFAEVINKIGGVWIDVSESERKVMNNKYIPYINSECGIKCQKVSKAGYQLLDGGQALAYSRDRYTGSDVERGSRQREVLAAMFDQVKHCKVGELADLCATVLDNTKTSLTNKEMIDMGMWALTEKPTIENLGLPDADSKAYGKTINGTWYYLYDLDVASKKIHDFILETGDYIDPKSVAPTSSAG